MSILSSPHIYNLWDYISRRPGALADITRTLVKPFDGCRILDIGCGTSNILNHLPTTVLYDGLDLSHDYIQYARKRWAGRGCRFECRAIEDSGLPQKATYDVVLAIGVLHHLDYYAAKELIRSAYRVLKSGGALVTYDPVIIPNQNRIARCIMEHDRGRYIRTVGEYFHLLYPDFDGLGVVNHNRLRYPYTIWEGRFTK